MNEIQIFRNEEFGEIRTIEIDGQIYFVGVDVAKALGYIKPRNAIAKYVDEDDALKWGVTDSLGRVQKTTVINESGLYSLILSSKLERAKEFKHWVTSEVLPEIRRNGVYSKLSVEEMFSKVLNERIEAVVSVVIDEKVENIVDKAVTEAVSETVKALSPFLTLTTFETDKEVKIIKKPYKYHSSKILRLSPEIREQVDKMIISGEYSCQQIADFITDSSGMEISYMTVSRYIKKYFTL